MEFGVEGSQHLLHSILYTLHWNYTMKMVENLICDTYATNLLHLGLGEIRTETARDLMEICRHIIDG